MPVKPWTAEMDEALRELWDCGDFYAEEIGTQLYERFGRYFSKNAVIGRARRLHLKHKSSANRLSATPRKERIVTKPKPRNVVYVKYEPPAVAYKPPQDKWLSIADTRPVKLTDLEVWTCHFPVNSAWNEPATKFCGQPAEEGCPYCSYHRAIAYSPIPTKLRGKNERDTVEAARG